GGHRNGITGPDVGNACGKDDLFCPCCEKSRMRERFASDGLRDPQSAVAVFFDGARKLNALRCRHSIEKEPNTDFADIHVFPNSLRCHSLSSRAVLQPTETTPARKL